MGLSRMQCDRCGVILKEGEPFDFHGKVLCEDCYIYERAREVSAIPFFFTEIVQMISFDSRSINSS